MELIKIIGPYLEVGAEAQTRPHVILFDVSRLVAFPYPLFVFASFALVALTAAHWKH